MEFADRTVKEIMEAIHNIVKHNLTSEGKVDQSNDWTFIQLPTDVTFVIAVGTVATYITD
jgi:hypothetical protein